MRILFVFFILFSHAAFADRNKCSYLHGTTNVIKVHFEKKPMVLSPEGEVRQFRPRNKVNLPIRWQSSDPLGELRNKLNTPRVLTLKDYIEWQRSINRHALVPKMLELLRSEAVPEGLRVPVDAGLIGLGLVVSNAQLKSFLSQGILPVDRQNFKILTRAQIGLTPPREMLDSNSALLILDPRILEGMNWVAVDQNFANALGYRSTQDVKPTIDSLVNDLMGAAVWEQHGWIAPLHDSIDIYAWSLKNVVVPVESRTKIEGLSEAFSLFTDRIYDTPVSADLRMMPIKFKVPGSVTDLVALVNPMSSSDMNNFELVRIVGSRQLVDWLPLVGSKLEIVWDSKITRGTLEAVRSAKAIGGTIQLQMLDQRGSAQPIFVEDISRVELVEYIPNGPRSHKVSITREELRDPAVREFINGDSTDLVIPIVVRPY